MSERTYTIVQVCLAILPFWIFAASRDSDEIKKTAISVGGVTICAAIHQLSKGRREQ